jgi:hypothetical protein
MSLERSQVTFFFKTFLDERIRNIPENLHGFVFCELKVRKKDVTIKMFPYFQ